MAKGSSGLTDRDRYWLGHHGACEKSGLTAKAYAKRHRLSVFALYQSRMRLRGLGVLKVTVEGTPKAQSASGGGFARVEMPAAAGPRYRVRLRNGVLVEWEGASGPELAEVLQAVSQIG